MERRGRAGLFGHHTGTVDLPERVAALWCPHVTRASCFRLVKMGRKSLEDQKQASWYKRLLKNIYILIY